MTTIIVNDSNNITWPPLLATTVTWRDHRCWHPVKHNTHCHCFHLKLQGAMTTVSTPAVQTTNHPQSCPDYKYTLTAMQHNLLQLYSFFKSSVYCFSVFHKKRPSNTWNLYRTQLFLCSCDRASLICIDKLDQLGATTMNLLTIH